VHAKADARGYVAERYRKRLPGASIGKSCVRFKRLDDLDEGILRELIRETAAGAPGARSGRRAQAAGRRRKSRSKAGQLGWLPASPSSRSRFSSARYQVTTGFPMRRESSSPARSDGSIRHTQPAS